MLNPMIAKSKLDEQEDHANEAQGDQQAEKPASEHEHGDESSGHAKPGDDKDAHAEGSHDHDDHGEHGHDEHGHDSHGDHGPEISAEDWTVQNSMDWYLSPDHLIAHVQDQTYFEIPVYPFKEPYHLEIPNPLGKTDADPLIKIPDNEYLGSITFQPTKFVVLELFAAFIVAALFIALGKKVQSGKPVKGRFWNMLEAGVVFVRDEIARPSIGTKDATRFLPLIWTVFFFVLAMNLIGMVPGLGAATGSISVTSALALVVFAVVLYTGMKKMGVAGFWKAQAPHIDLSGPLKYILVPMIWAIEVFGLFIKHLVLAVRLFANMFAGHLVLAVFVAFIGVAWNSVLALGVVPGVIGASLGVNLLELLVAFIQAYVFAFLTALFIGAAIHPH